MFPNPQVGAGAGEEAGARPWDPGSRHPAPPQLQGSENTSQFHFSQLLVRGWGWRVQKLGRFVDGRRQGPRGFRGDDLATGGVRGRTTPFVVLDCVESHPRLGRNKPRASWGHSLTLLRTLALPSPSSSEATASPGGQTWNRDRGDPPSLSRQTFEERSQDLTFIATDQRPAVRTSLSPIQRPAPPQPPAATAWAGPQGAPQQCVEVPGVLRGLLHSVQAPAPSVIAGGLQGSGPPLEVLSPG